MLGLILVKCSPPYLEGGLTDSTARPSRGSLDQSENPEESDVIYMEFKKAYTGFSSYLSAFCPRLVQDELT